MIFYTGLSIGVVLGWIARGVVDWINDVRKLKKEKKYELKNLSKNFIPLGELEQNISSLHMVYAKTQYIRTKTLDFL